jgi:hypothetical protein
MGFQFSAKAYDHALVMLLNELSRRSCRSSLLYDPDIDVESAATKAILAAKLIHWRTLAFAILIN